MVKTRSQSHIISSDLEQGLFNARPPCVGRARTYTLSAGEVSGGPGRTRTCDQGIHLSRTFLYGADYLITLSLATGGVREALACYQEH